MPLAPAITDIEQLKDRPFLADLLAWRADAIESARFDRNELTIYIAREAIREACARLKAQGLTDFMSDLTCADFYPREPRFELAYHLLSMKRKERVRLKVRLSGDEPSIESITAIWPSAIFLSARSSICSASAFSVIRTCAASCCRKTGKAILCARTIRWRAIVNGPL